MSVEVPVRVGDVLAGKYRVDRIIGSGGMGVVVAATHLELERRVALKFLLPDAASHPETVERFLREARAMARVTSEHIVRVADVGRLGGRTPYIVMEYLSGRDLFDYLRERRQLSPEEACDIMIQACDAIAEAHSLGIIHRDLKPANLFLTRRADGTRLVKVLDFGLAKETRRTGESLTDVATVMGTPAYMSPEQLRSTKDVDERGDVWALAVILFELLTGRSPFDRPTLAGTMLAIATDPAPSLLAVRADLPPGLADLLAAALRKDRSERTESVAAFAAALAPFGPPAARTDAARIVNIRPPSSVSSDSVQSAPTVPLVTRSDFSSTSRARRQRSATAGVALAMVVAVSVTFVLTRRRDPDVAAVGPPDSSSPSSSALVAASAEAPSTSASTPVIASAAPAASPAASGRKATPRPMSSLDRLLDGRK